MVFWKSCPPALEAWVAEWDRVECRAVAWDPVIECRAAVDRALESGRVVACKAVGRVSVQAVSAEAWDVEEAWGLAEE